MSTVPMTPRPPMRFSLPLFPYDRFSAEGRDGIETLKRVAARADELGFYALQMPEHVIMPVRADKPTLSVVWYDNAVLAAHLSAVTRRLRFIFHVMVVPYRHPLIAAKTLATLDQVSGGRLIVGTGTGWLKGEFRALNVPFEQSGARTDDYLAAMVQLWTQERPAHAGPYCSFDSLAFEPKCRQRPHVPLWIGGSGPKALDRVVRFGQGWVPMTGALQELAGDVARLKERLANAGKDPSGYTFSFGMGVGEPDPEKAAARLHAAASTSSALIQARTPEEALDLAELYAAAGLNHLGVTFQWRHPTELLEKMEEFAGIALPGTVAQTNV